MSQPHLLGMQQYLRGQDPFICPKKTQPLNNATKPKTFLTLHFPVFVTSSGASVASRSTVKEQQLEINRLWLLFRPHRQR